MNRAFALSSSRNAVQDHLRIDVAGLADPQIQAARMNYNYVRHFAFSFCLLLTRIVFKVYKLWRLFNPEAKHGIEY